MQDMTTRQVIRHFDLHGQRYKGLRDGPYEPVFRFMEKASSKYMEGQKLTLLEVGCAGGAFLRCLAKRSPRFEVCVGLDLSNRLLRNLTHVNKVDAVRASASFIPFRQGSFDCIIMVDVLHHIVSNTPRQSEQMMFSVLRELLRTSKLRAIVLIRETPILMNHITGLAAFWLTLLSGHFSSRYPPVMFLTSSRVRNIVLRAGLRPFLEEFTVRRAALGPSFLETVFNRFVARIGSMFLVAGGG